MARRSSRSIPVFSIPCADDEKLQAWIEFHCAISVPRAPLCPDHDAPFDYLRAAYFEPARDLVVWAPRGGGKTKLAAIATLLDLLHKPGIAVRLLGGSLEQSFRMWEHLYPELIERFPDQIAKRTAGRSLVLVNRSSAAVLAQSQRAVRGLRVQKLRCDEVELFDPEVWNAAQLVTRSRGGVRATIEALSTLHRPFGLMSRVVDDADRGGKTVLKWCLLDVLETCPAERDCATCPLHADCGGRLKHRGAGGAFFSIDDAIAIKQRVSLETWEAEMLCRRPNLSGCVFPHFDPAVHVRETHSAELITQNVRSDAAPGLRSAFCVHRSAFDLSLAMDFGFHNPFVCLWVATDARVAHVVDEYVQPARTLAEHLEHIEGRRWGKVRRVACDPAGAARNDQTAESDVRVLRRHGYDVHARHTRIPDGLELIRAALRPAHGEPTLFIDPRCTRLIRAMRSYHYPDGGGELPVKDGEHDHLIDALRYWFVNRQGRNRVTVREY